MLVDPYLYQEWMAIRREVCTMEGVTWNQERALHAFKRCYKGTERDLSVEGDMRVNWRERWIV